MRNRERLGRNAKFGQGIQQHFARQIFAGDNRVVGSVRGGDGNLILIGFQSICQRDASAKTAAIVPLLRKAAHQARAFGDETQTIFQGEDTCDTCGDIFADAVPKHGLRFETPREPHLRESIFKSEERGLGIGGLIDNESFLSCGYITFQQGRSKMEFKNFRALIQRGAKDGLRFIKLTPHADVLRALPGEEEGDLWLRAGFCMSR
jgi:hypothetical protein